MSSANDERGRRGMRIRREVLGDEHVDRAVASTTPFTEPFQTYITGAAWADVWGRPGLDRRTRSAITLAVLTALRAEGEIAMHVRAARRNGLTADEIAEVLLHATVYAGVPAGNAAFRIAAETLESLDDGGPDDRAAADTEPADRAADGAEPADRGSPGSGER